MKSKLSNLAKYLFSFLLLILFLASIIFLVKPKKEIPFVNYKTENLFIGNQNIKAYISDTDALRELGLSNTQSLKSNEGMIFIFATPTIQNFWMKEMKYDIDILWLDENYKFLSSAENAKANSYDKYHPELSETFHSPENTKYVLELVAGQVKNLNLKVGDTVLSRNLKSEVYKEYFEKYTLQNGLTNTLKFFLNLIKIDQDYEATCHYMFHGIGHGAFELNQKDIGKSFLEIRKNWKLVTTIPTCANGYFHGVMEEYAGDTMDKVLLKNKLSKACISIAKNDSQDELDCYHGIGHAVYIQLLNNLPSSIDICNGISSDEKMQGSCRTGIFMEASKDYDFTPGENKIMSLKFCDTLKDDGYEAECFNQVSYLIDDLNQHRDEFIKNLRECKKITDQESRITCIRTFVIK